MLGAERVLLDDQRVHQERLCFSVPCAFIQVPACSSQQSSRFRKVEAVLINQLCERLRVWNQTVTQGPVGIFDSRENSIHCTDSAFGPYPPGLTAHLVSENCLHQAMKADRAGFRLSLEQ